LDCPGGTKPSDEVSPELGGLHHGGGGHGFVRWCERPDGTKHGPYREWCGINDRVSDAGDYCEGRRCGTWKKWSCDGKLLVEQTYVPGTDKSTTTRWWPNGKLRERAEYEGKQLHGPATTWYEKGTKESEGRFSRGKKLPGWTHWNEDGTPNAASTGQQAVSASTSSVEPEPIQCSGNKVLVYKNPGCGEAAKPSCVTAIKPCVDLFCGCQGESVSGCGVAEAPFKSRGPCPSSGADE
jgi:hypothetical protein